MAETCTQEQAGPKLSEQISAALADDGKFTYSPGMSFEIHKDSRRTSKFEFQDRLYAYTGNAEMIEHAFVIAAILKLGTATKPMILDFLHWQKRMCPSKQIPLCGKDAEANMRTLKVILKKLCGNGLVISHDYVANVGKSEKSVIVVYTGTMYGHTLYRNILEEFMEFDMNSVFRADVASFRMLATNAVMLRFAHYPFTTGIYLNGRYGMEKPYKKIKNHIYGLAETEVDGTRQVFLAEPLFFRYNPQTRTEEQVRESVEDRLDKLAKIIEQIKELDDAEPVVRVIYVVENMEGLRNLFAMIGEDADSDVFRDALFTSENVVYAQGGDLSRSFLKLQYSEQKGIFQFKPAHAGWYKLPQQ